MGKANFQALFEAVTRIEAGIAIINERCVAHSKIMAGHGRTLYGENGTMGLIEHQHTTDSNIEKQEVRILALEDCKKDIKDAGRKFKDRLIDIGLKWAGFVILILVLLAIEHWASIKGIFGL